MSEKCDHPDENRWGDGHNEWCDMCGTNLTQTPEPYTPTMAELKAAWVDLDAQAKGYGDIQEAEDAVDRALDAHDREVAGRALKPVIGLLEKWNRDLLTYPASTNEKAKYAATALLLSIDELAAAISPYTEESQND